MKSPYLLSIVSGILIGTSYIPFPPWAIFFCFVPLWWAWLQATSLKQVFWTGWITQFVLTLIGFNWVTYTVHEFGHLPWPAAVVVLFAFCSICTLSIPLAGIVWWLYDRNFKPSKGLRVWTLVAFMSISERIFPMIFDWHFGYTWLWAKFPAFHLADMVGFIGLSNIGLFFNGCILQAIESQKKIQWLSVPVIGFAALNVFGYWHSLSLPQPDATMRVLVAQANIGNEEKLLAETGSAFRDVILNRFYRLTAEGIARSPAPIDFAVWPETAFPEYIDSPELSFGFSAKLRQAISTLQTKLITGGYSHLQSPPFQSTNSFFVLNENGQWMAKPYHKTVLLAFGEYFPGANLFPKLRQWFPEVADFGRGPGPTVISAGSTRIGAQICYEGLFDWFSRRLANKGAQILVNLTNDSWYGTWQEPYQHGFMTLSRAIEVRRPLVRSTNTGISTVILANGTILEMSPLHQEWQHVYEIPYNLSPPETIFMSWGYWMIPFLILLTLVVAPALAFRRKKL